MKEAILFRKTLPHAVDIPDVPGWSLSTIRSPEYVLYTRKYGDLTLQVKVMGLFEQPYLTAFMVGLEGGKQKVYFHESKQKIGNFRTLKNWLRKYELMAERVVRDQFPDLAQQLKLAEDKMSRRKKSDCGEEHFACGDDVFACGDEMFAGRKWGPGGGGYGKEYTSTPPGNWEPASKGSGRHEEQCKGYGLGGTEDCYNTDASQSAGLGSTKNMKTYNKNYRKKRFDLKSAKEQALKSELIRLAYVKKEMRPHLLPLLKKGGQFDNELAIFNRQWPNYQAISVVHDNEMQTNRPTSIGSRVNQISMREAQQLARKGYVTLYEGPNGWRVELTNKGWKYWDEATLEFRRI
jgi:hypothetical protein